MDKISAVKEEIKLNTWAVMISECNNSGMSVSQWCNENCINLKTYYYRLKKVREKLCENKINEEHIIVPVCNSQKYASERNSIQITCGSISIEIPTDTATESIKTILETLKC